MHVTHHIPKILSGEYVTGLSGGSLQRWLRFCEEENGLNPKTVWRNVKRSLGVWMLAAREEICRGGFSSTEYVTAPDDAEDPACRSHGFHFIADMVVDSFGRAWVMEVHLTMGIKSPGLGDPEAGYDEVLTRETRQGVFGAISMAFARFMDMPYRNRVEAELFGGSSATSRDDDPMKQMSLLDALVEDRMLCRLDVESVLPRMWRDFHVEGTGKSELQSPVNPQQAAWYAEFEDLARSVDARGIAARKNGCRVLDFNRDRVWKAAHKNFF